MSGQRHPPLLPVRRSDLPSHDKNGAEPDLLVTLVRAVPGRPYVQPIIGEQRR